MYKCIMNLKPVIDRWLRVCVVRDSNIFDVFQAYFEQAHQLVINENILLQTLGKSQQKCCPRPYGVSTTECQMRTQVDFCLMWRWLVTVDVAHTMRCEKEIICACHIWEICMTSCCLWNAFCSKFLGFIFSLKLRYVVVIKNRRGFKKINPWNFEKIAVFVISW